MYDLINIKFIEVEFFVIKYWQLYRVLIFVKFVGVFLWVYIQKKICNYMYIKRGYVERKYVISLYVF